MRASLVSLPFLMISSLLGCASNSESVANEEEMQEETTLGTVDFHFDQTKLRLTSIITEATMRFGGPREEHLSVRATLSREGAESLLAECMFGFAKATEQAPAYDWLGCSKAGMPDRHQFVVKRVGETITFQQDRRNLFDWSLEALGVKQDLQPHTLSADAHQGNHIFTLIDSIRAAVGSVAGRPSEFGPVSVESWWATRNELWLTLRYGAAAPFKRSNCFDPRVQPRLTNPPTTPSGVTTMATQDEIAQHTAAFIDGSVANIKSGDSIDRLYRCKLY